MAGTSAGTRFSGMWRPANTTNGSAGSGLARLERPGVLALEHRRLAPKASGHAGGAACSREKQKARWGSRGHSALDR